jgi:hypothetical protein
MFQAELRYLLHFRLACDRIVLRDLIRGLVVVFYLGWE